MIRDCNGQPYQPAGSLATFDPFNPDLALMDALDAEYISLGIPLYYYECMIQSNTTDKLYREDRGKIFSTCPIMLSAIYEPVASQNSITGFGIDSLNGDMQFQLNYRAVLKAIGHPPKIGSRIFTPHLRENWEIIQRNIGGFTLWNAYRLILIVQKHQESTTSSDKSKQREPDFKLNEGSLLG